MNMVKGIIEADREILLKEITFGKIPVHRNSRGTWVSNEPNPEFEVIETNMGTLMDEEDDV